MSEAAAIPDGETGFDRPLRISVPERNARGRFVRLGPALDTILGAHSYPPAIKHLLAEALVLTALLGALLKDDEGQLTMQAQTEDGIVDLLACDYRDGELRGYVRHDQARFDAAGGNIGLAALFGRGYLAITFDVASTGQRYQGVVPLEGDSLAEAVELYFAQSEQVPTLIRVGIRSDAGGCVAGGMLMQHLPEGEEGRERLHVRLDHPEWQHIAVLAGSVRHDELIDPALSLETIAWRLFHDEGEIIVSQGKPIVRGCRCSVAHYRELIERFPDAERAEMRNDAGIIEVDCAFCSRIFEISA